MIAALETFPDLQGAAMTDLHSSVVEKAKHNVLAATKSSDQRVKTVAEQLYAEAGDVMTPLQGQEPFDLIYE